MGAALLGSFRSVLARQSLAGPSSPPGLRWFRLGRSFLYPEPWLGPGRATSSQSPGVQEQKPPAEGAGPHGNTTRGPACPTPGAEEGGEGGVRVARPFRERSLPGSSPLRVGSRGAAQGGSGFLTEPAHERRYGCGHPLCSNHQLLLHLHRRPAGPT